jgi:hypothetical protein
VSFNIGDMISGAVTGFLETGDPFAAGAIGLMDGISDQNQSAPMAADSMLGGGSDASSLIDIAQLAAVFAG